MFLFFVGVIAGFLDTLVGGGGLIAVPALLLSGIPPIYVLGTNKLQGSMGTGIATFLLLRKKKLEWQMVKKLMIASFIGSVLGGIIVQFVDTEVLSFVIPIVLVFIAIYFIVSPKPKQLVLAPSLTRDLNHMPFQAWDFMMGCLALAPALFLL